MMVHSEGRNQNTPVGWIFKCELNFIVNAKQYLEFSEHLNVK